MGKGDDGHRLAISIESLSSHRIISCELFSIYGMRNELLRHCHIQKVSLIDGMINNRAFESMAMDRVSKGQINR